jgi:TPR repeat protein
MKLAASAWFYYLLLTLLALLPLSVSAGMTAAEVKAFEGYMTSALKGDPVAQTVLGACYYVGNGVAKDQAEAVKWWRKGC